MGEAKLRGSYEARVNTAIKRKEDERIAAEKERDADIERIARQKLIPGKIKGHGKSVMLAMTIGLIFHEKD